MKDTVAYFELQTLFECSPPHKWVPIAEKAFCRLNYARCTPGSQLSQLSASLEQNIMIIDCNKRAMEHYPARPRAHDLFLTELFPFFTDLLPPESR